MKYGFHQQFGVYQAMKTSAVFLEVINFAEALGVHDICHLPGCWEHQVDEHWWIAANGHTEDMVCSSGATVPPAMVFIRFNGWPAGFVGPREGCMASGAMVNEETFIAALQAARRLIC